MCGGEVGRSPGGEGGGGAGPRGQHDLHRGREGDLEAGRGLLEGDLQVGAAAGGFALGDDDAAPAAGEHPHAGGGRGGAAAGGGVCGGRRRIAAAAGGGVERVQAVRAGQHGGGGGMPASAEPRASVGGVSDAAAPHVRPRAEHQGRQLACRASETITKSANLV